MKRLLLSLLALATPLAAQTCDGTWRAFSPGDFNGRVHAILNINAGPGAGLYATGDFTRAGNVSANHLAYYDGLTWSEFGGGLNGPGFTLAMSSNNLYVGGTFSAAGTTSASNIAARNLLTGNWNNLSGGCNGPVWVMKAFANELLIGGEFSQAGGLAISNLAAISGGWQQRGPAGLGTVRAITSVTAGLSQNLWVGGYGPTGGFVKEFDGAGWQEVGAGLPPVFGLEGPYAISPYSPDVKRWTGNVWTTAGTVDSGAFSITEHQGYRYVGSWHGLFRLDAFGATLIGQVNGDIRSLVSSGSSLLMGGMFTSIGTSEATCIAELQGNTISPVANTDAGQGAYRNVDGVYSADLDGNGIEELYATGLFQHVGATRGVQIARWDGSLWAPLGEGMQIETWPGPMLAWQGNLYVTGQINGTPSVPAFNIAAWDGQSWSALGAGLPQPGAALCIHDDGSGPALHAGGFFGVRKWDGSAWHNVADMPTGGIVKSLQSYAGKLYAGGHFASIGTTLAKNLARWDGANWTEVGGGVQSVNQYFGVQELLVYRGNLMVGGTFFQVGGQAAQNLASWRDSGLTSGWSSVGGGVSGTVRTMDIVNNDLYVGGSFGQVGSVPAGSIARWTGLQWKALGGGIAGSVHDLAGFDPDGSGPLPREVIAGGLFQYVDGMPTGYLASWTPLAATWSSLGGGIPGALPVVSQLRGSGSLSPNSLANISLMGAAPNTSGGLGLSVVHAPLPVFGGTWHANPLLLWLPLQTDGQGRWQASFAMPALPCGMPLWVQALYLDPGATHGLAFSNGLRGLAQ